MNVRLASVALQRWMSRYWTSQVHQTTCYHGSWGTWLVLNKLHISNKYLDKRSEREFLTKNLSPALLPSLSPSARSEWSTGFPILPHGSRLLGFFLFLHICKVWSLHVHHTSPSAPTSGIFLCRSQLRRRQMHSGSCCRYPFWFHTFVFRVSFPPRRGSTCSSTSMAIPSRWQSTAMQSLMAQLVNFL